ncbi:uncharacterized protein J3D65DRAFT_673287 [Phyllosticta citribraziliensis]|uniref:Mid2 domain-containing protein n=1 Tax=Phyllosticta citribraziliensis TaxID=989973 RepID=A0ABR1MBD5_9PEZI
MWLAYLCLILVALARNAFADDENYFSQPGPEAFTYNYSTNPLVFTGDSMLITWSTTYDTYDLELWQLNPDTLIVKTISRIASYDAAAGDGKKQWIVDVDDDTLGRSPIFCFWINTHNASEPMFASHFFNITDGSTSTSPTTTSTSPESSLTSPATAPSTSLDSIASFPTGTTLSTATSSIDDGASEPTTAALHTLSSSAPTATGIANGTDTSTTESKQLSFRLGMGLGLGIPILLVAGAAIGVAVDRKRKSSAAKPRASIESDTAPTRIPEEKSCPRPESPIISPFIVSPEEPMFSPAISELRGREIYEMPANEPKVELGSH